MSSNGISSCTSMLTKHGSCYVFEDENSSKGGVMSRARSYESSTVSGSASTAQTLSHLRGFGVKRLPIAKSRRCQHTHVASLGSRDVAGQCGHGLGFYYKTQLRARDVMFLYGWVERRALTPQAWQPWLWLWLEAKMPRVFTLPLSPLHCDVCVCVCVCAQRVNCVCAYKYTNM